MLPLRICYNWLIALLGLRVPFVFLDLASQLLRLKCLRLLGRLFNRRKSMRLAHVPL
jgi:hypothetical protein